ncbi:NAD regulator [Labrenzia sp. CE80]|uniref:NUDIX hydrolase n=1 Tax=Labrenzia sp. CE80 TaxID=1788986 RepID=UPI00129ACB29|nr:NAD regulator [Labrenzia sp. CE80]
MTAANTTIEIGLNAVIVAVADGMPQIVQVGDGGTGEPESLPFGAFDPLHHRTFEIGLRSWVEEQTALQLGYVEQLYTFGDRGRHRSRDDSKPHVVSVGYLALARQSEGSRDVLARHHSGWRSWYDYFPWEDWRDGRPGMLDSDILPALMAWAEIPPPADAPPRALNRMERLTLAFGLHADKWDEERALERYELLYEASLVEEALRDGRPAALKRPHLPKFGRPMRFDHRRVLATAMSRLRAKLKYRPVVFELMPGTFTLTELQTRVEAIFGRHLHKQNFRRLVENADLVEPTGATSTATGGRPAALFRFRHELLKERPAPGLRVGGR